MRCEVVAVGTELLIGQVIDTNSSWIGDRLAAAGIDCHFQVKVGDNHARIVSALRAALDRADAVICCGGLGPTQDDITRAAIAEVMGVDLVRRPELVAFLRSWFAERGTPMPENNLLQADVPLGAEVIPQTRGSAPGLMAPVGDGVIYAVPGVPHEMRDMIERAVLPDLRRRAGSSDVIASRTLRTWGQGESALAELVAPRLEVLEAAGNPTIAFLASGIEGVKVRVTAKGSAARVEAMLGDEERELRSLLGADVFGVDDGNEAVHTMEAAVGEALLDRGWTLGVAESLTGGLMGARLTAVPGASAWFRGGIVSYASEVKFDLLGVPSGPVVSGPAAEAMAAGAARVLGATVGLAVTGVAGPTEQDGQPVGTVWVGLLLDGAVRSVGIRRRGDRERIRQMTVISALDILRRSLREEPAA